jgi:serine/threonine protein kinase
LATFAMYQLRAGDQLDDYKIDSLVAESGMACIFRATDTRNGQTVALKVPHFEVEVDPMLFDRFKREEEIGIKLNHPGVMKVFETEDRSRLYMVMEWIEGKLLRNILNEERQLSEERAIRLTLGICEALSYVHEQGVIHRDLKPENIMVDEQDHIKLIDFGLASSGRSRRLTFGKFSRTMGTADYISPEQVKSNKSDARSDVYALGVMFYEMLTGAVPFRGDNPLAVMNDRLLNDPVPPREANPELSVQLQEIIYRALERDPANRYPSAEDFANDLRNPSGVNVAERGELHNWTKRRSLQPKTVLVYASLIVLPLFIFAMVFIAARNH